MNESTKCTALYTHKHPSTLPPPPPPPIPPPTKNPSIFSLIPYFLTILRRAKWAPLPKTFFIEESLYLRNFTHFSTFFPKYLANRPSHRKNNQYLYYGSHFSPPNALFGFAIIFRFLPQISPQTLVFTLKRNYYGKGSLWTLFLNHKSLPLVIPVLMTPTLSPYVALQAPHSKMKVGKMAS